MKKLERLNTYITKDQKEWLVNNSIAPIAKKWGHPGKTQSDHVRDALDMYIKKENQNR